MPGIILSAVYKINSFSPLNNPEGYMPLYISISEMEKLRPEAM